MNRLCLALTVAAAVALNSLAFAGIEEEVRQAPTSTDEEKNSTELFEYEFVHTFKSNFKSDTRGAFGEGDSTYNLINYAHRFHTTGNWYLRLGVEYERFDFGGDNGSNREFPPGCLNCTVIGNNNGLPDHLQTIHALLAYEYIFKDHAGAGIEIDPGPYFQNDITGDSIDVPWKVWVTFPLKKDKIFGVIGAGGSIYSNPIVAPGGGLIWLFSDNFRLEGVFPKPALVYNAGDDWEFRIGANLFFESYRTDDVITHERKLRVRDAIVQYSEKRVGAMVTYSHFKPFEITLDGGCMLERDFEFFRADASAKTKPAPYVRLAIEAKF